MTQHATTGKFERFDASDYTVGIVAAQFNREFCEAMLEGTLTRCEEYGVEKERVKVLQVPGSVEIPVMLAALAQTKKYDCLLALGVIIRGETPHFDYVAKIVSEGITRVMLDQGIPIGFGILTCDTVLQAQTRLSFGSDAMRAALHSAKLIRSLRPVS